MRNSHKPGCAVLLFVLCLSFLVNGPAKLARAQESGQKPSTSLGIQLYVQGDTSGAIKILQEVVHKHSDDADAWYYLGLALNSQGSIGAARQPFESVVKLRPDLADAYAKLSYALILANEQEKAMATAQRAIELGDNSAGPHYAFAEASLRTALNLRPEEETLRTKSLEIAIENADTALQIDPNFSLALITRTFALNKLKKYSEAAASLERFLALSPDDLDTDMWREQLTELRASDAQSTTTTVEANVLAPGAVTTKARVLSKPEPSYTESARRAGVQGRTILRAVFSSDGEVKNIRVLQALPFGLTTAAIQAARLIKFTPATKEDRPVSMYIQLEYNFHLY
jgi:TonB family protein